MKQKKIYKAWLIVVAIFVSSCVSNDTYFQYQTVNPDGWSKDSLYTFDVPISDTVSLYNVYVNVRNRGEYPYQNLWLFMNKKSPDNIDVSDSIECYLADQRGKWLGTGLGAIKEMPILYKQNVKFDKKGIYRYSIVQGMREDVLIGINDIGIKVEKASGK